MRNTRIGVAAFLLSTVFAATSFAATAAPKAQHVTGKVSAVDASAMSLTISANGKIEKISWSSSTPVLENGKNVGAAAISTGEEVKIAYSSEGGKNLASSIDIVKAHAAASATKKPAH